MVQRSIIIFSLVLTVAGTVGETAAETPNETAIRHRRVTERRNHAHLICHRGALEYAHENTLEAYRAAFELGGDGNEIDIRITKDGVLVCFHDDMIDHLLEGYGDVSDYAWEDLQKIPFRDPERFGTHCRIPALREALELHRHHAGLIFLDIKRPGLNGAIGGLLDEYDMWDHVVQAPGDFADPRLKRTTSRAGMYLDRTEVDPEAIAAVLKLPGERILLESPQLVAQALGRTIGPMSKLPVRMQPAIWSEQPERKPDSRTVEELLRTLNDADDWNRVAPAGDEEKASAERILTRAKAADELTHRAAGIPEASRAEVLQTLERRVRERSLHRDWRYCGLDGCSALRALVVLKDPGAPALARFCLWRDDPEVEAAMNPMWKNPRAWTDFRTKIPVFNILHAIPGAETEQICRDYLAMTDEEAKQIGIPQFEEAARCLLAISPQESTVRELEKHRLSAVRGRAKLFVMAQAWK